jgi:hypothetical protein
MTIHVTDFSDYQGDAPTLDTHYSYSHNVKVQSTAAGTWPTTGTAP